MSWYYWGVHTDNGKPYFGSPRTHKWIWDFYDCEIQILERFETRKAAEEAETRLIRNTWDDPCCLNENCGGNISQEGRLRGIQTQREQNIGLFNPSNRQPSLGGKSGGPVGGRKTHDLGIGVHASGVAQRGGIIGGKVSADLGHLQRNAKEYGLRGGPAAFNKKVGVHDPAYLSSEQYKQHRANGGKKSGSYRYRCNVTGYEGVCVNVIKHQKKLGIEPSAENRTLLEPPVKL